MPRKQWPFRPVKKATSAYNLAYGRLRRKRKENTLRKTNKLSRNLYYRKPRPATSFEDSKLGKFMAIPGLNYHFAEFLPDLWTYTPKKYPGDPQVYFNTYRAAPRDSGIIPGTDFHLWDRKNHLNWWKHRIKSGKYPYS